MSSKSPVHEDNVPTEVDDGHAISKPATRTLTPWIAIQATVIFACYQGVLAVLLPNQLTHIDAAHKVTNLAAMTTVFFVVALIAQPLIGAFSDRTRNRLGRRAPWMLTGAAVAALGMIGIGQLHSLIWIAVVWGLISIALNALQGPLSAIIPDRYPRKKRGAASAMYGLGTLVGAVVAVAVAGKIASNLGVAYAAFGILMLVVTLLFVFINRDSSSRQVNVAPFRWREFLAAFWVSPVKYPDYGWAFLTRFLFTLGYFLISTYQLFILTDYLHLSLAQANGSIGIISLSGLPAIIVAVIVSGYLSDKLGRRKLFIWIAAGVLGVGLLIPLAFPSVAGMIMLSVATGLGFGIYLSCDNALMTEVLPKRGQSAAKDLGILNMATNIPQALAPILAAILITSVLGYSSLFVIGAALAIIGGLVVIPIKGVR